jgi:hypothetical protein
LLKAAYFWIAGPYRIILPVAESLRDQYKQLSVCGAMLGIVTDTALVVEVSPVTVVKVDLSARSRQNVIGSPSNTPEASVTKYVRVSLLKNTNVFFSNNLLSRLMNASGVTDVCPPPPPPPAGAKLRA